jgi:hemerythrin-like domain-containing protein
MYREMMDDKSKSTVRQQIDDNLKRIYDETLAEQVPDRFADLLSRLREQTETGATPDPDKGVPS